MELTKTSINLKNIYAGKKISEDFEKKYLSFEEFREELCKNIEYSLEQVEKGEVMTMEEVITEMEELYNIKI